LLVGSSEAWCNFIVPAALLFSMPNFKVEFSNYAITLPEHGLDFPNVESACEYIGDVLQSRRH
jgi:hypothetical protein